VTTPLQRAYDRGEVALPDERPPWLRERAWSALVRHLRERASFAALGRAAGVSRSNVRQVLGRVADRLRHPEVAHLPAPLRRALVAGGYPTRAAIATAPDEALLALPCVDGGALWRLRHGVYEATADRDARWPAYQEYHREHRPRPAPVPQARGDLPPAGGLLADDDGARLQCHVCGQFRAGLALHVRRAHGLSPDEYRERYGLARGQSLYAPAYAEKLRRAALARDQGAIGAAALREVRAPHRPAGRPTRLSTRIRSSASHRRGGAP
jgi:ROS/MUCR transcriptional regulator protein